jgi:hypothetical protein
MKRNAVPMNLDHARATKVRALEAQLLLLVPMKRPKLAQAVRAEAWPAGAFEEAVTRAVKQGKILELPLDWLRAA